MQQDLGDPSIMHGYCWGRKVPIRAARKQLTFDKVTATAKRSPRSFCFTRTQTTDITKRFDDSQSIFGGSTSFPASHVKELAKTNAKPAVSKRKHPANGRVISKKTYFC